MADRQETVTIKTKSDLPEAFKAATKSAEELENSVKDVGEASKGSAAQTEGFTDRLNKAKVAFAALKAAVLDTIAAYAEQDALVGQLSTSYERFSGGTAADVERGLDKITENSIKYGVAVNDQIEGLKNLAQASGDAMTAEQDLALAIDISAQENLDLATTTKLLAKARLGDAGALAELGAFQKSFVDDLNAMTDSGERSKLAIQALTESYGGAAEANKGLADDLQGTEEAGKALFVAVGKVVAELGGFLARTIELLPFLDKGELSINNIVRAFTNFAEAIENTSAGIEEFKLGLDNLDLTELLWSSDDAVDVIHNIRLQGKRAGEAAAESFKEGAEEGPKITAETFYGPEFTAQTKVRLKKEADEAKKAAEKQAADQAKEEAKRAAASKARAKKRKDDRKKEMDADAKGIADAKKRYADEQKEKEIRAFRDRQARLIMEGEERLALQERLENSGATEGESELALKNFDETADKLQRELELREEIAVLKRDGLDLEAEAAKINASNMTDTEKSNALEASSAAISKAKADAALSAANSAKNAIVGTLQLAGAEEAAKRASAGMDGLIYQYQAIGAFGLGNYLQGAELQVAALSAFAVAGGSSGGGGGSVKSGGGSGSPSGGPAGAAQRSASADATRTADPAGGSSKTTYVLNLRSLSKPTRREAREFLDATERERRTRVGG